jgi:hypothetical protein
MVMNRAIAQVVLFMLALCALVAPGCQGRPDLVPPEVLVAPYAAGRGEPVWAVAPLRNESGVSVVDANAVADALVARLGETRGITCLPLNRTFAAMRAIGMSEVRTPSDARRLAQAVGADAIIVGTITAYDPYDPPKLGLNLGLFGARRAMAVGGDPQAIQVQARDMAAALTAGDDRPLSVISEHLDSANHAVLMNVRRYAEGRHDFDSALGWKRYTASMELYTQFAAWYAAHRLIQEERLRLAAPAEQDGESSARQARRARGADAGEG